MLFERGEDGLQGRVEIIGNEMRLGLNLLLSVNGFRTGGETFGGGGNITTVVGAYLR
jgi:hypothetical protein